MLRIGCSRCQYYAIADLTIFRQLRPLSIACRLVQQNTPPFPSSSRCKQKKKKTSFYSKVKIQKIISFTSSSTRSSCCEFNILRINFNVNFISLQKSVKRTHHSSLFRISTRQYYGKFFLNKVKTKKIVNYVANSTKKN